MPSDKPRTATSRWDCHVHVFSSAARVVRPGHYTPAEWPLDTIEAQASRHGFDRLVLVQPSVYGTDNSLMLDALAASRGQHRGVMVVDAGVSTTELLLAHEVGVRGVRFNMVSPVGSGPSDFPKLAPRLRELGWHVQWYVAPEHLADVAALHRGSGLPCVLDHLAGAGTHVGPAHPAWETLGELAGEGAWIKLSGWYRLKASPPYPELHANVRRLAGMFTGRTLWGSDWPHTWFPAQRQPGYAEQLRVAEDVLTTTQLAETLQANPARLYA